MINLIPNHEKKKKVKDFYFRLGVVAIASLGVCVFMALLAILPSYFLSQVEKNLTQSRLETQKNEPVPDVDQDSLKVMEELDKKVRLIENAGKKEYFVSEKVIDQILLHKMSDIKIQRISYENTFIAGKEIGVYGVAPNRERLLIFRRALEDDVTFSSVDLPISNFIKGSDIEFYLNLHAE